MSAPGQAERSGAAARAVSYPSDEAAMKAIQEGHLDVLGVLYERHAPRVWSQCSGMVNQADVVDDLVQEVFLRVLRYRASYRGDARFTTWLFRIARNVCFDHLSADERRTQMDAGLVPDEEPCEDDPGANDRVAVLRQALDRLDPEKARLVQMRRLEGLGYTELAERLDVSEGAVRVRVHRAMAELKSVFDSLWGDPT